MKTRIIIRIFIWITCLQTIIVITGAASNDIPVTQGEKNVIIQDSPEILSTLKVHAAYITRVQDARMEGVIDYIDGISGSTGTDYLRQIQEDYLTAAFSIPIMRKADEIYAAREGMRLQSILFADETNVQIQKYNGTVEEMREMANSNILLVDRSFNILMYSSWLGSDTTRQALFNQSSERRKAMIETLRAQGLDVLEIQNLSGRIDAQHSALEDALLGKQDTSLPEITAGLKLLNQQFRTQIEGHRQDANALMKKTDFMSRE